MACAGRIMGGGKRAARGFQLCDPILIFATMASSEPQGGDSAHPADEAQETGPAVVSDSSPVVRHAPPPAPAAAPSTTPTSAAAARRGPKVHPCTVCDKIFTRPSALDTHMNIHSNSRPHECKHPGCDAAFTVKSNMKRHRRTHGDEFHDAMEAAEKAQLTADGPVFEEPIVVQSPELPSTSSKKLALQWLPPNAVSRNAKYASNAGGEGGSGSNS